MGSNLIDFSWFHVDIRNLNYLKKWSFHKDLYIMLRRPRVLYAIALWALAFSLIRFFLSYPVIDLWLNQHIYFLSKQSIAFLLSIGMLWFISSARNISYFQSSLFRLWVFILSFGPIDTFRKRRASKKWDSIVKELSSRR